MLDHFCYCFGARDFIIQVNVVLKSDVVDLEELEFQLVLVLFVVITLLVWNLNLCILKVLQLLFYKLLDWKAQAQIVVALGLKKEFSVVQLHLRVRIFA